MGSSSDQTGRRRIVGAAALLLFSACTRDDGITAIFEQAIATTAGDFDNVSAPFNRMVVEHQEYEGLISTATWSNEYDPDNESLKVEGLLGPTNQLKNFGTAFIASGTRGLGKRQYNGLEPDDQFLADERDDANELIPNETPKRVKAFVRGQGNLLATDWAYDLIEQAWPDAIEFLGDDTVYDDAQVGEIQTITARITNEDLVDALGMDTMALTYDFSNWAVVESVEDRDDAIVWLRGDIVYALRDGTGTQTLTDVPLLVSFQPEGANLGKVVYATFHLDAQTPAVIDELLRVVVGEFDEQAGEPLTVDVQ